MRVEGSGLNSSSAGAVAREMSLAGFIFALFMDLFSVNDRT
jgi:hypothetical protein